MYDVIRYLFKYHLDRSVINLPDRPSLRQELEEQGFSDPDISHAFNWLTEQLTPIWRPNANPGDINTRSFSLEEEQYLNAKVRGFILYLEQLSILEPVTRELLIETAIHELELPITLEDVQSLALTLLADIPGNHLLHIWLSSHLHADKHRGLIH